MNAPGEKVKPTVLTLFAGAAGGWDVRELTASRLVSDLGYLPEIICGSPPCQDVVLAQIRGAAG